MKLQAKVDSTNRFAVVCGRCLRHLARLDEQRREHDGSLVRRQLSLGPEFHLDPLPSGQRVWRAPQRGQPRRLRRFGPIGQGGYKKFILTRTTPEGLETTDTVYRGADGESLTNMRVLPRAGDSVDCPGCECRNVLDFGLLQVDPRGPSS